MIGRNILVINSSFDNERLFKKSYCQYAQDRGHNLYFFTYDVKEHNFSLLKKLLFKRCAKYREQFYKKLDRQVLELLKKVDYVCMINLPSYNGKSIMGKCVYDVVKQKKCVLNFVDLVTNDVLKYPFLDVFDTIYVLEEENIDMLKKYSTAKVELQIFGTPYVRYAKDLDKPREYDICFVGLATPKRMEYIEAVAKYCKENNRTFWLSGHFWNTSHWWTEFFSKREFQKLHPYASEYVRSMYIEPADLAKVYCDSKIILNVNIAEHKMLNWRVLDAMACKGLVITDTQSLRNMKIFAGKHYIEVSSPIEMVEKIDFYLSKDSVREEIADSAYNIVKNNYDVYDALDRKFEDL